MVSKPPKGTETIILAEDYEMLRGVTKVLLESHGYRVIEAADGREAVERFASDPDGVDLVILDLNMPRKGGIQAYREISKLRPGVKTLFTSGSDEEAATLKGLNFINKPSSPDRLIRMVKELLGG